MMRPAVPAATCKRLKTTREIAGRIADVEPMNKCPFAAVQIIDIDHCPNAAALDPKSNAGATIPRVSRLVATFRYGSPASFANLF